MTKIFTKKNAALFAYERGAGLWIWKPYFVAKALASVNDGDYIFHCDAGAVFISSIKPLLQIMKDKQISIMPFELPLLEKEFTKSETFHLMDYHQYNHNQILGSYFLIKKDNFSVSFINEWLNYIQDERILSPKKIMPEIPEFKELFAHREDQSIFSILCRKHHLEVFRDPSGHGIKPLYQSEHYSYNPKLYPNSPYSVILLSNKRKHPFKYFFKYFLKKKK